jgi:hypothetical protein
MKLQIINQSGQTISEYIAEVSRGIATTVNISHFAPGNYTLVISGLNAGNSYLGRFVVIR